MHLMYGELAHLIVLLLGHKANIILAFDRAMPPYLLLSAVLLYCDLLSSFPCDHAAMLCPACPQLSQLWLLWHVEENQHPLRH